MKDVICRLSFLMLCLTTKTFAFETCPYKECGCIGQEIRCNYLFFYSVPSLVNDSYPTYQILHLQDNWIGSIPDNSLPANLTYLDLKHNPIENISSSAFDQSATTLQILAFSNAKFTELPDALLNLTRLRTFELRNTVLSYWDIEILNHLGKTVTSLHLRNVGFESWPDWMYNFPLLKTLSFYYDSLRDIPNDAFKAMDKNLTTLELIETNLTYVPLAISTLSALEFLSLRNNFLTYIQDLPSAAKIRSLDLGNNEIFDVSNFDFELVPFAYSLEYLDLQMNNLTHIPHLSSMVALQTLDLSSNLIEDPFSGFFPPHITSLYLNLNYLPSIPEAISVLSRVTNLEIHYNKIKEFKWSDIPLQVQRLDIGGNKITEIKDDFFPANSSLQELQIQSNRLVKVYPNAFKNLTNLECLDIRYADFSHLPLALSDLTNAKRVDFRGNILLDCSCDQSSLVPWFLASPDRIVFGWCEKPWNQMALMDYFTTNATYCS